MSSIIINVLVYDRPPVLVETPDPEALADALHIPVLAEIEPQPDLKYGHTFKWPEEVQQFIDSQNGKH